MDSDTLKMFDKILDLMKKNSETQMELFETGELIMGKIYNLEQSLAALTFEFKKYKQIEIDKQFKWL